MKKFFTLLSVAFAAVALNAQTWDMTAWETADVTTETTIDGLTYHGESKSAYAAGSKTFADGQTWEGRVKFGGGSTCKEGTLSRVFSFSATKGSTVKVYAVHGSSSGDDRIVYVTQTLTSSSKDPEAAFGSVATVAAGENPGVLTATVPADGTVYVWADNNVGVYAIKLEAGSGEEPGGEEPGGEEPGGEEEPEVEPQGTPETYVGASFDGENYVANEAFVNAVIADGASTVEISTESMKAIAVGGTTAKDVYQEAGTDFAGWTEWNDVKWDLKNQGDIQFGYILGTGNPAVAFDAEEVLSEEARTGHYRPVYTFYEADGSKGMPLMGLYYKFSPKVDGQLKVNVWSNKGNRNTFIVDEDTAMPIKYKAEGYINAQNEGTGEFDENGNEIQRKKWLSAEEIQFLHDNAKCEKDADGNIIPGTDSAPWVIGAGNQPAWVTLTVSVKGGKTYWLFQHSSQIGFQSYTFTPNEAGSSISSVEAEAQTVIFNLRGERVNEMTRGQIYVQNGKKVLFR